MHQKKKQYHRFDHSPNEFCPAKLACFVLITKLLCMLASRHVMTMFFHVDVYFFSPMVNIQFKHIPVMFSVLLSGYFLKALV